MLFPQLGMISPFVNQSLSFTKILLKCIFYEASRCFPVRASPVFTHVYVYVYVMLTCLAPLMDDMFPEGKNRACFCVSVEHQALYTEVS